MKQNIIENVIFLFNASSSSVLDILDVLRIIVILYKGACIDVPR